MSEFAPAPAGGAKKAVHPALPTFVYGRVSADLKTGIVGLPNVGKTSILNFLCSWPREQEAITSTWPFETRVPNKKRSFRFDERLGWLRENLREDMGTASVYFTDAPGLIRGSSGIPILKSRIEDY